MRNVWVETITEIVAGTFRRNEAPTEQSLAELKHLLRHLRPSRLRLDRMQKDQYEHEWLYCECPWLLCNGNTQDPSDSAIGQGVLEGLLVRSVILEARLAKKVNLAVHTDSTTGKSMASRFDAGKTTKYVGVIFLHTQDLIATGMLKIFKLTLN